jgi:chromosome segregation ATPase
VPSIYTAIQNAASARVELLERDAGSRITEAGLEIEKLERENAGLLEEREAAVAAAQNAGIRAERVEGQLEMAAKEADRLRAELDQQRSETRRARDDGAEERGQLSAELERARDESERLATQIAALQQRQKAPAGASGR